jgi:hypothetical protein
MSRRSPLIAGVPLSSEAPWQRLVFGLVVLATGVLFWLDHIGRIDAHRYFVWWPLALIAMGVAHVLERRWFGAAIWILIGAYVLLPRLGIETVRFWRLIGVWPLLISVGGIVLVMQALRGTHGMRAVAIMGANVRKIGSRFTGGEAVAVMGGCEIDISAAQIENDAVLDVLAFWGGISVRVPRGCNVIQQVTPILGGYENRSEGAPDGPRLIIRGSAIMGGVEVGNRRESAD